MASEPKVDQGCGKVADKIIKELVTGVFITEQSEENLSIEKLGLFVGICYMFASSPVFADNQSNSSCFVLDFINKRMILACNVGEKLGFSISCIYCVTNSGDYDGSVALCITGGVNGWGVVFAGVLGGGAWVEGGFQVTGLGVPPHISHPVILSGAIVFLSVAEDHVTSFKDDLCLNIVDEFQFPGISFKFLVGFLVDLWNTFVNINTFVQIGAQR